MEMAVPSPIIQVSRQPGEAVIRELARLHVECLPDSLFSRLGLGATHCLYRFMAESSTECFVLAFDAHGVPLGASVTSLQPSTLLRRALLGSSLAFWLLVGLHKLPWRSAGDSTDHGWTNLPELMFLFVSPALRSSGTGRELVLLTQSEMLLRGQDELSVMTEDVEGNRAISFYRSLGYESRSKVRKFGKQFLLFTRRLR